MKQNRICKSISLKSNCQLELFKKRQSNYVEGTLKLVLGKYINEVQELWFEEYRNCPIRELRELHSNELAFEHATLISKASYKLALQYGHFMLNENMVFKTAVEEQLFIWINPDLFMNQSKIFLPDTHEGQMTMIKSLINYFKLWLQTDYSLLGQVKTLQQLQFKIYSQKNKNSSNAANSTNVQSQGNGQNQGSNSTSKNKDATYSYRSKNVGKLSPSVKDLQNSQAPESFNNKIQFKHIFPHHQKNGGISSKHSESNFQKQDDFLQINHQKSSMSRTTGNTNSKYFPCKTTSVNSKMILGLIRRADDNPDEYVSNNIKMDPQKLREIQEEQMKRKMKQSFNGVGDDLDNLFLSNMEEQEEDFQQSSIREKQFEELLG